jgi:thiol:disulfide interchange protein DsbG
MPGSLRNLLIIILIISGLAASLGIQAGSSAASRGIASNLLDDIDQATWITEGSGKHIVYIFFDPNCPHCHKLYETLRPLIARRDLQLRWVPVAMLTDTSLGKAAAILQAADPLSALQMNEDDFGLSDLGPGGAITPAAVISDRTRLNLAANLSLLQGQNLFVVPVVVFRATDGEGLMFFGVPATENLNRLLQYVQ